MAPLIALVVGTLSARLAGILGLAPADSLACRRGGRSRRNVHADRYRTFRAEDA
ncbi:Uncharacterised protein [Mycobacteroides abscessus subsp. massiliense]|nr:Uncharacterised protein [Mycobacteroides abscessus subsp. massiliense]SKQ30526.1 Uncharacterised protein [Mycobacteroides abscessus subsp. massiliense]SKS21338.1 Uncharacterised protein [Mycobacteroides abscessus subsp. massiliense]SKT92367.1 Uncharacterised protein [Mycobacteroides abscessus subsp. massiliense]SKU01184.1 Uncharacterised protein [Mycobacteroides abscessus subsp. massiliense]